MHADQAIDRLQALPPDWDSYGAEPSSALACAEAKACLREVVHALGFGYATPLVGPIPAGVTLVWQHPGQAEVHAVFTPAGQYLVLAPDGTLVAQGEIPDYGTFAVQVLKRHLAV